ncbi:MAG: hypothetical protein KC561_19950, partial [Myxococcales bacterium]|nr:hypothetical protein [Myxococcales bacterium]
PGNEADANGCVVAELTIDDEVSCTVDACNESTDTVTNTPDDGACPTSGECFTGVCSAQSGCSEVPIGCEIGEACVLDGTRNPDNPCEVCDITQALDEWTAQLPGSSCGEAFCTEDGDAVGTATCNDQGACVVPDATDCGDDGCQEGRCLALCSGDVDCPDGFWCDEAGECVDTNRPPVADAGEPQNADEFELVTLDGRASADADLDPLSYEWQQITGPEVELNGTDTATPTFDAPRVLEGQLLLEFELTVSDGLAEDSDTTSVTVENATGNAAPIAVIDAPDEVAVGQRLSLNGSQSSDPDGDTLTYLWSIDDAQGLEAGSLRQPILAVIPSEEFLGSTIRFGLIVSDGLLNSELTVHEVTVVSALQGDANPDSGPDMGSDLSDGTGTGSTNEDEEPPSGCGCQSAT